VQSRRTLNGTILATSFVGITELEASIRSLRTSKPGYRFVIASEVDHHHDRFRYRWDMISRGRTLMEGLDIVTIDPSVGLICVSTDSSAIPLRSTMKRQVCPLGYSVKPRVIPASADHSISDQNEHSAESAGSAHNGWPGWVGGASASLFKPHRPGVPSGSDCLATQNAG